MEWCLLKNKGQLFSLDVIIAAGAFILILIAAIVIWEYTAENVVLKEKRNDMQLVSMNVLSALIETKGNPVNWTEYDYNETNVLSLGIASNRWILDENRIESMQDGNYDSTKKILGIANYDFELLIDSYDGSSYAEKYSIGISPSDAENIIVNERFALFNNSWSRLRLKVYENE